MKERCYHVTYYYNASGMEGNADTRDYGFVYAFSKEEAIRKTATEHGSDWGLSAKEISPY